jgi:hypothetical protein
VNGQRPDLHLSRGRLHDRRHERKWCHSAKHELQLDGQAHGECTTSGFEHKFRAVTTHGKEPEGGLHDIPQAPKAPKSAKKATTTWQ